MGKESVTVERIAAIVIVAVGAVLATVIAFRYLIGILLPFLGGFLLSHFVRRPATAIAKKTRVPVGVLSVSLVLVFGALLFFLFFFAVRELGSELVALLSRLSETGALDALGARITDFFSNLPFFSDLFTDVGALVSDWARHIGEQILSMAPSVIGRIIAALPGIVLFAVVFLFSAFYFCLGEGTVRRMLLSYLPEKWTFIVKRLTDTGVHTMLSYLRVYLILTAVTFTLLLFGFLFLRIPYAWILALLLSLVDLLPLLGVGSVLIPWGAFSLLFGNRALGVGLFVLYGGIFLLRQLLEPRLIGKRLGMHPLPVLFFMYGGYTLFGISGMLLAPPIAVVIASFWAAKRSTKGEKETETRPFAPKDNKSPT